jgi:uncharacterized membrane protein (UPF0127 family)
MRDPIRCRPMRPDVAPVRTRRPGAGRVARLAAILLGAALSAAAGACPRPGSPAPDPAPRSRDLPRVVLPSGAVIKLERARTDEEKAQGLMYRASMAEDAGMIFLFDSLEIRPFWMKNCHFPLDLIYTLSDGTVVDVLANVPPCAADPCPSYPPGAKASTVVEVNAGVARKNGVAAGSKLRFSEVPAR